MSEGGGRHALGGRAHAHRPIFHVDGMCHDIRAATRVQSERHGVDSCMHAVRLLVCLSRPLLLAFSQSMCVVDEDCCGGLVMVACSILLHCHMSYQYR